MRRPRICVERDVPSVGPEELLELLHGGRRFEFVGLREVAQEGRLRRRKSPLIVAFPRPVEEDDGAQIRGDLLRQPKSPECSQRKTDDSGVFSPHAGFSLSFDIRALAPSLVDAVAPPYRSGANATNPAVAKRSQSSLKKSFNPHHAWRTRTPGPWP